MTDYVYYQCPECNLEAPVEFPVDESGQPIAVNSTTCPHCGYRYVLHFTPDNRPDPHDWTDGGDIIVTRTAYALNWWRHNREIFVQLRYRPRAVRRVQC